MSATAPAHAHSHDMIQYGVHQQMVLTSEVEEGGRAKVDEAAKAWAPALPPASAAREVIARYACRMRARCIRCVRRGREQENFKGGGGGNRGGGSKGLNAVNSG